MPDEADDNSTEPTPTPTPKPPVRKPSSETKPAADKKNKPEPTTAGGKLWHNWVKPIGLVVIIVVLLRSTLLDWNDVPTGSMEPEIQVGDRIFVNRLAYALQVPLTGPQIGIPFTDLQWNNPLDGIPQLQWGKPDRGDIVTFWNPVTKVRMVKRIVAEPGDTISMSGGMLTINGQTATYKDITASPPRRTKYFRQGPMGKPTAIYHDLEDLQETLLGETRTVQHIKERWIVDAQLITLADGQRATLSDGIVRRLDLASGRMTHQPLNDYLQNNLPVETIFAAIQNGAIRIDGKPASYNDLAAAMLQAFGKGEAAKILAKAGLAVEGHKLLVDGQAVSLDIFEGRLKDQQGPLTDAQKTVFIQLTQTLEILGLTTMTNFGPITLGDDEYFMVGDNRNNSHDSRRFGPVKRGEITGEAFAVAFSFKDNKILTLPPKPAWSRWLKDLD